MYSGKRRTFLLLLIYIFAFTSIQAQNEPLNDDDQEALESGIQLLKKYFEQDTAWYIMHPETGRSVGELIRFIEKQPFDSIKGVISHSLKDTAYRFVYRLPEHVPDSLQVPGYYNSKQLQSDLESFKKQLYRKYFEEELAVPVSLLSDMESKAGTIPPGEGKRLFDSHYYKLPDSLNLPDVIPDSMMQFPVDFSRFLRIDSLRNRYIEQKRLAYNDSVLTAFRNAIIEKYRRQKYEEEYSIRRRRLADSVRVNNFEVLRQYNDTVVRMVNSSIARVVSDLVKYADLMDTTRIRMTNLQGEESSILLQNDNPYFSRVWLKNEQNDSLRVLVKSLDKRSMQMLIDDGVTISRFRPRQTKDFDFKTLQQGVSGLTGMAQRYQAYTPWRLGGDGTVGFTQTYLENWKKGGQSALSLQIVLKGFANYSRHDGKVKWENSGEIRNGWIRPGGEDAELQKNDDKFEITSRFGVSAFKKWYYSAEFNYETQFFNGYKYPTSKHPDPISAFMAPARTFFKLGLDYKPNNNFSLFLSPLTAKNVFVRDTAKIDQVSFGIDEDKRSAWEPGLNTDIFYRRNITSGITWETKYKMFINYLKPFGNLDMNWENLLIMPLTDRINMRMLVHFIYDQNVLFPVYDANEIKIDEKPKLQLREFITIGFTYKINRQVTRARRND
jgi:hypothetical protein